jgi:hypothetical protein
MEFQVEGLVTNSKAVLLFCGMDFSEHAIKQQM